MALVLLSGCSPTADGATGGDSGQGPGGAAAVAPVSVAVSPGSGATAVRPDARIKLQAKHGRLTEVTVRPVKGGAVVAGTLASNGATWTTTLGTTLQPATTYQVQARAVDAAGKGKAVVSTFTTLKPTKLLHTIVTPGDGDIVGVGMPIMVQFTNKVTDRKAVQAHLLLTMSKPVPGAWSWLSSTVIHFRPKAYWPAGEKVTVDFQLAGLDAGNGVWGDHNRTVHFGTADAMVSTVDVAGDMMTVKRNGKVIRTIPITTGKQGYTTRDGVKIIMTKERYRVMDSTTVDIPAGSPDAYRLKVEYAMRLTWSGEFLHAAPWSVYAQGHFNVSHGCTGMSMNNAAWLYSVSHIGDVVQYVNSPRSMEPGNGYTDWNVPWATWVKGSAL